MCVVIFVTMIHELYKPTLEELVDVLHSHLSDCFSRVSVTITDCPDLATTYNLAFKGLCGSETLCDIGSFDYLLPVPNKSKNYDLLYASRLARVPCAAIMGASAGPHFLSGFNSEMVISLSIKDGVLDKQGSYMGSYDASVNRPLCTLSNSSQIAMVAQALLCEGKMGKVVELIASGRVRDGKFDQLVQQALALRYNKLDRPVGVGGVVIQETGKCKFHVLPEFCDEPLDTSIKVTQWLKFFEMDCPAIAVGTALSHDPQGWKIRLEHFHCFNNDRTLCGHCHFDSDGVKASYRAYLVPGKQLLRVDPPP